MTAPSSFRRIRAQLPCWIVVVHGLSLTSLFPAPETSTVGLLFEASLMEPPIYRTIRGAKESILVPARTTPWGIEYLSQEEWKQKNYDWDSIINKALVHANQLLDTVKIQWIRDQRKVIRFALIESDDPFISSIVFHARFSPLFQNYLGKELHVVIPERGRLYIFPKGGGFLESHSGELLNRYRSALHRVSLEIFLVDSEGVAAIGKLADRPG